MEITGKVHEVGAVQEVTGTFKKRDLVVEYAENPQYPEFIKFEATQDRVNILDGLSIGEEVVVSFNLRGRPWTNKEGVTMYFNTLNVWRVTKVAATGQQATPPIHTPSPIDISSQEEDDGLPF